MLQAGMPGDTGGGAEIADQIVRHERLALEQPPADLLRAQHHQPAFKKAAVVADGMAEELGHVDALGGKSSPVRARNS
jgi:hypothetical protein